MTSSVARGLMATATLIGGLSTCGPCRSNTAARVAPRPAYAASTLHAQRVAPPSAFPASGAVR